MIFKHEKVKLVYEYKRHELGHQFFFPQKFDLINLFLKLGHSLLFNVFCA